MFYFVVILFLLPFQTFQSVESGVKIAFPQYTIDYMVPKLVSLGEKLISVSVPDQTLDMDTPEGKLELSLTNFKLDSFNVTKSKCQIIPNNELSLGSSSLELVGDASFSYNSKAGKKTGSIQISLVGSFTLDIGAKIDGSHPSNLAIVCSGFDCHFSSFTAKTTGGDPWFADVFSKLVSASLLNILLGVVKNKIPGIIENLGQKALDGIQFTYPLGFCDISFSYKFGNFLLSSSEGGFISLGSEGVFTKPGIQIQGSPAKLPDYVAGKDMMLEMFFSDFSFNSLAQDAVLGKCVNFTIKDMFFLKTKYFKDLIPNLPYRYPNMDMQLEFVFDSQATPNFTFTAKSGKLQMFLDLDTIWMVILKVEGPMEAFTLSTQLWFECEFSVKPQSGANRLSGELTLNEVKSTIKRTFVGPFNVSALADVISTVFKGIVAPVLDAAFEWGMELPLIPYVDLKTPTIAVQDGFMEMMTSFTFTPPTSEEMEERKNRLN